MDRRGPVRECNGGVGQGEVLGVRDGQAELRPHHASCAAHIVGQMAHMLRHNGIADVVVGGSEVGKGKIVQEHHSVCNLPAKLLITLNALLQNTPATLQYRWVGGQKFSITKF